MNGKAGLGEVPTVRVVKRGSLEWARMQLSLGKFRPVRRSSNPAVSYVTLDPSVLSEQDKGATDWEAYLNLPRPYGRGDSQNEEH